MPHYQPEMGTKLVIPEEDLDIQVDSDDDVPVSELDMQNPEHVKVCALFQRLWRKNST